MGGSRARQKDLTTIAVGLGFHFFNVVQEMQVKLGFFYGSCHLANVCLYLLLSQDGAVGLQAFQQGDLKSDFEPWVQIAYEMSNSILHFIMN